MRLSPFWADVLRPAFHALAPDEARRVATRVRNAAIGAALLGPLLPRFAPLGTGTQADANLLAGAYAVAAFLAHQVRNKEQAGLLAAAALAGAGLVPLWASDGHALWGLGLAAVAALHAGLSRWRRASVELAPPPVEPDPLPRPRRGFPVLLGGLAYTLATVLVFWHVVTQHTKVPTGSMQPTIMGDGPMGRYGGDRLLADHAVYMLRDPRRWEIVVFRYPLRRDILFVKRLIGLPGEEVEIRGGDIWVDGQIARKPAMVQETLWQELFPRRASAPSARPKDVANAWRASEDDGWRKAGERALRIAPRDGRLGVAAFRDRLTVPDVRVGFSAEPVGDDAVAVLRVTSRGHVVTMEVPAAGAEAEAALRVEGGEAATIDAVLAGRTRVELAVVDGRAVARVDGREVASLAVPLEGAGRNRAEVGGRGGELVLRDLRVEEDVEYVGNGGLARFDVPEDAYVVLGDNTRQSEDSRMWRAAAIHVEGRDEPYVYERSSPDMAGGLVRNMVREGGRLRFVDADGLPRDIPASSVTKEEPATNRPYVPRQDMVGRAALIFWPVPPLSPTFRPRFLP